MIKLISILDEIKILPALSRIYVDSPEENKLKQVIGKNLKIGDFVYFLTVDKNEQNGELYYQRARITKIQKQQKNHYSFYYKIYVNFPNTGFFTATDLYVLKGINEIKIIGKNNITPESLYKLSDKINYEKFNDKAHEMGWDGKHIISWIENLSKDEFFKFYIYVITHALIK